MTATFTVKPTGKVFTVIDNENHPIAVAQTREKAHEKAAHLATMMLHDPKFNYWYDRVVIEMR